MTPDSLARVEAWLASIDPADELLGVQVIDGLRAAIDGTQPCSDSTEPQT